MLHLYIGKKRASLIKKITGEISHLACYNGITKKQVLNGMRMYSG